MNSILFEDKDKYVWSVVLRDSSIFGEFHKERDRSGMRIPRPPTFNNNLPLGFFDGSS